MLQKRNTNVEQWAINTLNEPKFLDLLQVKGDHDELLEAFTEVEWILLQHIRACLNSACSSQRIVQRCQVD